ncbi:unnamed protein product [Thelazia callipaeda]|uniref:WD repeat-containing protein 60 n=1 Tax=Thelazia callipaeda TaxID=103827 RepID=A0A0N5CL90_THECL|nr:unnamed protein product [Thelazia callipaeda]
MNEGKREDRVHFSRRNSAKVKEEIHKPIKKNEKKITENTSIVEDEKIPLSSIDKTRRNVPSGGRSQTRSKLLKPNIVKIRNAISEESRKNYTSENRKEKLQKTINAANNSINVIKDNSIDKSSRPLLNRKSSKSSFRHSEISKKSLLQRIPSLKESEMPSSNLDEYNYKDDFEDYVDDFEEDSESEEESEKFEQNNQNFEQKNLLNSQFEINENTSTEPDKNEEDFDSPLLQRLLNSQWHKNDTKVSTSHKDFKFQNREIDLTNLPTTDCTENYEVRHRYQILTKLIGMERIQFELLDHYPIRDYDFYMQMFGHTNKCQAQTQTREDDVDINSKGCGIENDWESNRTNENFTLQEIEFFKMNPSKTNKLRHFVTTVGQVLIDLTQSSKSSMEPKLDYTHSYLKCSAGYNKFSTGSLTKSSKVTCALHREDLLFIAFYIEETEDESIIGKSILVEFNICISNHPTRILLCENEIQCLCMAPDGTSAIFAGLAILRWPENNKTYPLRTPAYDTSFRALKIQELDEQASIVAISETSIAVNNPETYQIVTINEVGTVNIWTVINDKLSSLTVDEEDLGLRPGAQLKLSQTMVIRPVSSNFCTLQKTTVTCMVMVPENPGQFITGTSRGDINTFVRSKAIKTRHRKWFACHFQPLNHLFLCIPTIFYTIHKYGLLLEWDLAKSKTPNITYNMNLKNGLEIVAATMGLYANDSKLDLLTISFNNGEVELHKLLKSPNTSNNQNKNSSLLKAIESINNL